MRRITLVVVVQSLLTILSFAQINGIILDEAHAPLPGVIVTLKKAGDKKIVTYGRSDSEGKFRLKTDPNEGLWLHFSLLGFRSDSLPIHSGVLEYRLVMKEEATNLREVLVTAKPITATGDTVTYLVSNFSEIQDRTLADVLKKMPGIEVSEAGQIKYQGKSINKFYIEGRDMLGGKYGLATNTINPEDVGSVEVMENHQPIAALRDLSYSQDPAINIRLKEKAKNRLTGTATLEGGYTDDRPAGLWDGRATAVKFGKNFQTLNTLRSTNTGMSSSAWDTDFLAGLGVSLYENYTLTDPLASSSQNSTNLPDERILKGPKHLFSTNNLWGVGEKADLTGKATYSRNTNLFRSNGSTIYYLPNGEQVLEETNTINSTTNTVNTEVTLLVNRDKLYLNDQILGNFQWENGTIDAGGTHPHTQGNSTRSMRVENKLNLLLRKGSNLVTINSLIRWQKLPISVMSVATSDGDEFLQKLSSDLLFTNTSASFGYSFGGGWLLSMETGLSTMNRNLDTDLTGITEDFTPRSNNLSARFLNLYLRPELSYTGDIFSGKLSLPVAWLPYTFSGIETRKKRYFPLSPRITLDYQATQRMKLSLVGTYTKDVASDQALLDGYMLRDYRTLNRGSELLGEQDRANVSLSISYRNALEALFANATIGYNHTRSSLLTSRSFAGRYMVTEQIERPNTSGYWNGYAQVSKGFSWLRSVWMLKAHYLRGSQYILLQGKDTSYLVSLLDITGSVNLRPSSWITVNYEATYALSGEAPSGASFTRRNNFSQRAELVLKPAKTWRLELQGTHFYNEVESSVHKHYFLADVGVVYSAPKGWELSLNGRNLFNQKVYSYTTLDALVRTSYSVYTRPLEIALGFFFTF